MPTYEYKCEACGHIFEIFQSIKADPLRECPKCRGEVIRLIGGGGGIIVKGSGFYSTDYRKDKKKENACPMDKNKPACESCNAKK